MAFGTRRISVSVPANSTSDLLAGQAVGQSIEFPGRAFVMRLHANSSATGIQLTAQLSSELVLDRALLSVETAAGRGPIVPDDFVGEFYGAASDRIILRATNTTAGALSVTALVDVQPV